MNEEKLTKEVNFPSRLVRCENKTFSFAASPDKNNTQETHQPTDQIQIGTTEPFVSNISE